MSMLEEISMTESTSYSNFSQNPAVFFLYQFITNFTNTAVFSLSSERIQNWCSAILLQVVIHQGIFGGHFQFPQWKHEV